MGGFSKLATYSFVETCERVALVNHSGGTVRVKPREERKLDPNGSVGEYAAWHCEVKGSKVRLRSHRTGKYMRIIRKGRGTVINCGGTGGKWCWFVVHCCDDGASVKLESDKCKGQWVAVQPDGSSVTIGKGGPFCKLRGLVLPRSGEAASAAESVSVSASASDSDSAAIPVATFVDSEAVMASTLGVTVGMPVAMEEDDEAAEYPGFEGELPGEHAYCAEAVAVPTAAVESAASPPLSEAKKKKAPVKRKYDWKRERKSVVLSHHALQTLRVNPARPAELDIHGGIGQFARFSVELRDGGKCCLLRSQHTGQFVRIFGKKQVDCAGKGGKWCVFRIRRCPDDQLAVKLESCEFPGRFVAVTRDGTSIKTGGGGRFCKLCAFFFP